MKKIITAFFMAWGNFLTIPCPYKVWDNEEKNMMLAFLPSIGGVAGILWLGLAILLSVLRFPGILMAALLGFFIQLISGFMHLDGFMDVSDAVLSRRPLEDRQRILKDSRVGAFAVISVAFLLILQFASLVTVVAGTFTFSGFAALAAIPVFSRAASGLMVLNLRPLSASQYFDGHEKSKKGETIALLIQLAIYLGIAILIAYKWETYGTFGWLEVLRMGEIIGATFLGTIIACLYGRKQLDGMNGDIAGYGIAVGETIGLMVMALTL